MAVAARPWLLTRILKFKSAIWSKLKTVDDHTAHVHSEIKCNRVNAVTLSPFKSGKFQNIEPCCCEKYLIQVWLSSQDIRVKARATRESIYREWSELLLCSLRSLFFCSSIPQKCTKCTTVSYRSGGSLIRWAVLSRHPPTPPQAQIHTQTISREPPSTLHNLRKSEVFQLHWDMWHTWWTLGLWRLIFKSLLERLLRKANKGCYT